MARPIDEKIVAMKMDNSDFKRKATETTTLFGKITESLNKIPGVNLGKVTKDISGIGKAANNVDLGGLTKAVESITGRFSNLGIIATTALVNITNRAVDAGLAMMRSLGPEQIAAGFQEYELKMGSIGTMLANTEWEGATLEDVNRVIAKLNDYADETIYNFAEMTASIGRFTTAGVKLEDSATAIKGLGNLAAISGSNTMQLNTAMYQMSQMMAAGKMNLQDWNSLVNAGMAGKKTQDALLETAKAMGKNVDMSEGFRNSISDGWLTAEVFLETMKKFGEDEAMTEAATKVRTFSQMMDSLKESIGSGWAESFEIIIGDFEEATKLWTGISEFVGGYFDKQTDIRNKMLRAIFDGNGLKNVLGGLKNIIEPIGQILGSIGDGFRNAFPPLGVSGIKNAVKAFKDFTEGLAFSEKTVKNLETIFTGFFSIFAIGLKIIKGAIVTVFELIPSFDGLGAKIVELISKVASIPKAFNDANDSSETFAKAIEVLKGVISSIASVLEYMVGALIFFVDAVTSAISVLAKGDFSGGPWDEESVIVDKLMSIRDAVVDVVNAIGEAWSILIEGDFTGKGPWAEDSTIVKALFNIRDGLVTFGSSLLALEFSMEPFANAFTKFIDALKTGYNWVVDKFTGLGEAIKNAMPSGEQVFAGGFLAGMIAIVGVVLKQVWDFMQAFQGWGKIGQGVADTLDSVSGALDSFAMSIKANALLTIAIALGILAASFWVLSGLNGSQIANGLYMIIGSLSALVGAMAIMSKYDITGTGMKAAIQIVALSIAFSILSGALKKVSDMDWGEITKGLVGLVGVMGIFTGAIIAMSKFGGAQIGATSLQFIALAAAIHLMLSAVEKIAAIDTDVLKQGLTYLGIILLELGLFLKLASGTSFGIGASLGVLAVAGALQTMTKSIAVMGEMDVDVLKQGLLTIGAILAAIAAFGAITGKTGLLSASVGLLLIAGALTALVVPIGILGGMSMERLAKGLGAMAIALTAIGAASMLMTGMVAAGAGLVLVAAGLNLLLIPITALSAMSLQSLAIGIGAVAAGILLIGGAAAALGLAGPALLIGSAGIAALGIALLAAGAGVSLFATGLVTLAAMTSASITTVVAVLGTLIAGLASLIPMAVDFVVDIIVQMATAVAENAPVLAEQIWTTILEITKVVAENAPLIYEQFLQMILGLVETWKTNMPLIVGAVIEAMTAMLTAIAERVGDFIDAGISIITNWLDGIARSIPKIEESATNVIFTFIETMTKSVRENGPKLTDSVLELMGEILLVVVDAGVKMVSALFGWIPGVQDAAAEIGKNAEDYIRKNFGAKGLGQTKGSEFAGGLSSKDKTVRAASIDLTDAANNAVKKESMESTGENFGGSFATGVRNTLDSVARAAQSLASTAMNKVKEWLGIASPSKVAIKDGGWFGEGLAIGIARKASAVGQSAKNLALTARDSLNRFLDGFEVPDNELHFKAVVDYDNLDTNKFGRLAPLDILPDTSVTRGLVSATRADLRQNGNTSQERTVEQSVVNNNNQYDVHVHANGPMSKSTIRKMAVDVMDEIKNINDRTKISKGEEVVF